MTSLKWVRFLFFKPAREPDSEYQFTALEGIPWTTTKFNIHKTETLK